MGLHTNGRVMLSRTDFTEEGSRWMIKAFHHNTIEDKLSMYVEPEPLVLTQSELDKAFGCPVQVV